MRLVIFVYLWGNSFTSPTAADHMDTSYIASTMPPWPYNYHQWLPASLPAVASAQAPAVASSPAMSSATDTQMELCQTLLAVHGIPQYTSSLSHTPHTLLGALSRRRYSYTHMRAHEHMHVLTSINPMYEQHDLRTYIGVYKYS